MLPLPVRVIGHHTASLALRHFVLMFDLCDAFAVAMAKRVMAAPSGAHHAAASQGVPGKKSPPSTATTTGGTGTGSKRPATGGAATSGGGEPRHQQQLDGRILEVPNLRVFTFAELRAATRNFKADTVLGEGGFGRVHKGWVDERTMSPARNGAGVPVAVKKLNPESLQGVQEWQVKNAFWSSHCFLNFLMTAAPHIFLLKSSRIGRKRSEETLGIVKPLSAKHRSCHYSSYLVSRCCHRVHMPIRP